MKEESNEIAGKMTDYLNTFNSEVFDKFLKSMTLEHRTLQQKFTKLCLMWLEHCASEEYRHDLRNEDSHKISNQIVNLFKENNENFNPSEFLRSV